MYCLSLVILNLVSSLLNSSDSCSCISEMISMLGKLLLLLDVLFPGDMREKIIVAYFRLFVRYFLLDHK